MPKAWRQLLTHQNWRAVGALVRNAMVQFTNGSLLLVGVFLLYYGSLLLLAEKATLSAMALGTGLVFVLAATIDRFEVLKGMGMEAKTRRLDRTIAQAEVTLKQMCDLATVTGAAAIEVQSQIGVRRHLRPSRQLYEMLQRVKKILTDLDADSTSIRTALTPGIDALAQHVAGAIAFKVRVGCEEIFRAKLAEDGSPEQVDRWVPLSHFGDSKLMRILNIQPAKVANYPASLMSALISDWPDFEVAEFKALRDEATQLAAQIGSLDTQLTFADPAKVLDLLESDHGRSWSEVNQ